MVVVFPAPHGRGGGGHGRSLVAHCKGFCSKDVQEFAQDRDILPGKTGIISDIPTEEVDVVDVGVFLAFFIPEQTAHVGLPELVAAARETAAEFDLRPAERSLDPIAKGEIGFLEDEGESVVAASFDGEVCLIAGRIKTCQKQQKILAADLVVSVKAFELGAAEDSRDLGRTNIVSREGEDEVGI